MRVLVTGGRAPATLDLVRLLHAGGAEVHLAESLPSTITSFSRRVTKTHAIAPPRQQFEAFAEDLQRIVAEEDIDWVFPTCEELFWVAQVAGLPTRLEPIERLRRAHHKGQFADWCTELGLDVPPSHTVVDRDGMYAAIEQVGGRKSAVLKPCFSRFATQVVIRPDPEDLAGLRPTEQAPWVVQRYCRGPVLCTWGMAHEGTLTVHTAYQAKYTAGVGSAVHFRAVKHAAAQAWVHDFALMTQWTGPLAFDFVAGRDSVVALECNPRLTSGVHLLADGPALLAALTDSDAPMVEAKSGASAQIMAAMLLYGGPRAMGEGDVFGWLNALSGARDVSVRKGDLRPMWSQLRSISALSRRARSLKQTLLEASTHDIRWDGE
ncbi:MAG: hypothetical protein AB8H79_21705 [Myxococcota bacterium]